MQTIHFKGNVNNKFFIEVQGESHYQKNIREAILYKIMVEKDDLEYRDEKLKAHLLLEDENKYDPGNAVRVEIDNQTVGYLGREDANTYRRGLENLGLSGVVGECRAAAVGKREDFGKVMNFGIWLSLELRPLQVEEQPERKGIFRRLFGK